METPPPRVRHGRAIPKEERKAFHIAVYKMREQLAVIFPHLFKIDADSARPLALGIDDQIAAFFPEIDRAHLNKVLKQHTQKLVYLKALEEGRRRINLDGSDAGEVREPHRQMAKRNLLKIKRRLKQAKIETEKKKRMKENARKVRS